MHLEWKMECGAGYQDRNELRFRQRQVAGCTNVQGRASWSERSLWFGFGSQLEQQGVVPSLLHLGSEQEERLRCPRYRAPHVPLPRNLRAGRCAARVLACRDGAQAGWQTGSARQQAHDRVQRRQAGRGTYAEVGWVDRQTAQALQQNTPPRAPPHLEHRQLLAALGLDPVVLAAPPGRVVQRVHGVGARAGSALYKHLVLEVVASDELRVPALRAGGVKGGRQCCMQLRRCIQAEVRTAASALRAPRLR